MADIRSYGLVRHLRGTPSGHVFHQRSGRRIHDGTSQAFWFRPLSAVLSEVPVDDRELPMLFHARTRDYQDAAVQATITFRFADPARAAGRIDFSIDSSTGQWTGTPLEQVAQLLTELAQQHAVEHLATLPLTDAVASGVRTVREEIRAGLLADERIAQSGIVVVDVRVVAVQPEPDLERALQTPMRELAQQEADRATYERRARAVERERAISENELQSKIELAVREERLVKQQGTNDRRRESEAAAAGRIAAEGKATRLRIDAEAQADRTRMIGAAEGDAEAARMAAVADVDAAVLVTLALRELAGSLPEIGTLNLTPDVVTSALSRFAQKG